MRPRGHFAWAVLGLLGATVLVLRPWKSGEVIVPDPVTAEMLPAVREALQDAREAVLARPDSAEAWGSLGEACDAHHLYEAAALAYRQGHLRAPREFRWIYGLAVVREFEGARAEEVTGLFDLAIQLEPRYPPVRLRRGDSLVRLGRLEEAKKAFEQALDLDPDFAMAHRNLGQTLLALDDVPGAIQHLERAAILTPKDAVISNSLAQAYWRAGDEEGVARATEDARTKEPVYGVPDPIRHAIDRQNRTTQATDRRAKTFEQVGEWAEARVELGRLLEENGNDAALRWRLGRCLRALGDGNAARAELERALALRPDHLAALIERAALAQDFADFPGAAALYRRVLALVPDDEGIWKQLGACLGRMEDLGGALSAFERANDLSSTPDAELLHNWGTALARAGRPADAVLRLRAALELESDNAGTHYNLADALEALGDREGAIAHFERARALAPALPVDERLAALRAQR